MIGKPTSAISQAAIIVPAIIALSLAATSAGLAKEPMKSPRQTDLPGVQGGYRIVQPVPEPEEFDPATAGQFRIGDMDVRIGGNVTVDIGVGSPLPPRR